MSEFNAPRFAPPQLSSASKKDFQRYHASISFDGSNYSGFQRQINAPSVQLDIERALSSFEPLVRAVNTSGRTDKGVHAVNMSVDFDLIKPRDPSEVKKALNAILKHKPIVFNKIEQVDKSFHSRFLCTGRHYRYLIINQSSRNPFLLNRAWFIPQPIDVNAMQDGSVHFLGSHDFTTFRHAQCQSKSPIKTIASIKITQLHKQPDLTDTGEHHSSDNSSDNPEGVANVTIGFDYPCPYPEKNTIAIDIKAISFLQTQVRSMVGALVRVGIGYQKPDYIMEILEQKKRNLCPSLAPARGLYFMSAFY